MVTSEKRGKVLPAAMSAVMTAALCIPSVALADEAPAADSTAGDRVASELSLEADTLAVASNQGVFQGEGTQGDPYILRSVDDLVMLAGKVNNPKPGEEGYASAFYKLTSDVDLSGIADWEPIGKDKQHAFSGSLDGSFVAGGSGEQHATIRNLSCSGSLDVAGLFGYVAGDKVSLKNLKFENVNIGGEARPYFAGALAGSIEWKKLSSNMITNSCAIEGVEVLSGSISGARVGGIVGEAKGTSAYMCSNFADIKGMYYAGGIAGRMDVILCCANAGSVQAGICAGGIVAMSDSSDGPMSCYNGGDVRAELYASGISGSESNRVILGCFNDGFVSTLTDSSQNRSDAHMIGRSANSWFKSCYYKKYGNLYRLDAHGMGEWQGDMTLERLAIELNSACMVDGSFWQARGDTVVPGKLIPETFDLCSVSLLDEEDGSVSAYPMRAEEGETVTVSMTPDEGKEVEGFMVASADGVPVEVLRNADGTFRFAMPAGGAIVDVDFGCDDGLGCPSAAFADVEDDAWYHDAVDWAVDRGVLRGVGATGLMEPGSSTTRAQAVAMIARIAGEDPAAVRIAGFSDVPAGMWCESVVSWGVANGIVEGYGDTGVFAPDDSVTREQMAVFLYRFAQARGADASARTDLADFSDAAEVSDWSADAVSWAVESGILRGVGDSGLLAPGDAVTRAQAATMLERFCESCGIEGEQSRI